MDPVLPFRILSPGTRKPKFNHRVKDSKLSLKSRKGTNVEDGCKENKDPLYSDWKNRKRNGLRFEDSDLMTSDESDISIERYSQPNSVLSINTQESTFSLPVAESTRCDFPSIKLPLESTMASLHTASNCSNSSASTEYFTAYPLPVECDESIVCISDSSPEPEKKLAPTKNRLAESVLISSDESDDEPTCGLQGLTTIRKKLSDTVDLESSTSDVDHSERDNIAIPPSVKSDSSSVQSSVSSYNVKAQSSCDLIIPPSPDKYSESDIISDDSSCEKELSKASGRQSIKKNRSSCDLKGSCLIPSSSLKESPDCGLNESSWKQDFHLVLPDSQSLSSDKHSNSIEVETKLDKLNNATHSISREKYDDITRWIIRGQTACEGSLDSSKVPSFTVQQTETASSLDDDRTPCPQLERMPPARRLSSDSEDDDNFHALIESVRKKRENNKEKINIEDNSFIDDSFIDDCRSDVAESPSFDVYHSDLTKSIKAEVKSVKKTVKSIKKKQVFRNLYESDELSEDERTTSPISKPETSFKNLRKAIVYASDTEDSDTDFEIPTKGGKSPGGEKSDHRMKHQFNHSSDDSESSRNGSRSRHRNRKAGSPTTNKKGSFSKDENLDSDFTVPSEVLRVRNILNPPSRNTDSSNSTSSELDLAKKQSKEVLEKKTVKTSTATPVTPRNVAALKSSERPFSPIRTFLSSLSGPTHEAGVRDHPEAAVYNRNFKAKKEELTRRLFKLFNREIFDKRLPSDMLLEWNARLIRTAGLCYCKLIRKNGVTTRTAKIALSTKVITSPDRLRDTLIHEMCHAAVWLLNNVSGGHGPFWKSWAHKAMKRFPELPPIERCHSYNIETKFTYKCTKCGYSFGRHSKSLDLDTKRCGYCYGRFEVFLSSQVQGRKKQENVLKTPRAPNAFALFVKENYGTVKQGNAHLKHGDIMKKLSENFSSMKVKASD